MVRRKRDVAIIVLKCVIFGCWASAQQAAFGTGMAIPSKSAIGGYVLVAQADMPAEPQAIMQETKNADAPAEPQVVMQEIKSATRLSSSKQRRRKPKMAGVPAGSQVVVKETQETEPQALAKETRGIEPQAVVKETKETEPQAVTREAEETDTLDKPLAVAQKTKDADAPAKPQAEAEAKGLKVAGAGKKKYGMAPIRWGVIVSETVGLERHSLTAHPADGSSISSRSGGLVNTQIAEIKAKTYILQPYIAQLGGNIGVVSSKNNSTGGVIGMNGVGGVSGASSSRSNRLFGDGLLSLFPQSRFPFNMSLGVSDDRNSTELQTQDMVTKHLSLDQTYRPMGSKSTYTGGYSRSTQITSFSSLGTLGTLGGINPNDTATHSFWQGGYSTNTPEHGINVETRYNEKITSLIQNTRTDNFTVSDNYLPTDSLLSLHSVASLNLSADTNLRARYLQANTNANWQPESEDIPLFVNGGVRLFSMSSTMQGGAATSSQSTSSQSLGGNVGARYLFSERLTGDANGSVTSANSNGKRNLITTQRGNVTYSSHAIKLWKDSSYAWHANGGASNQTGGAFSQSGGTFSRGGGGSDSSVFGGVGHGLGVPYAFNMLGKKFLMHSRINQSLDANLSRVDGQSITLINGGSVSLGGLLASVRPDKEPLGGYGMTEGAVNTTATLSVDDRRTIGGKNPLSSRTYYLTINSLGASKSVYHGIEVEANLEAIQGTAGTELIGMGVAKYKKTRVFNVRGLDYAGSFTINSISNSRVVDVNAQTPKFPWALDQRLRYKIGQNEVLLRGLVSDQYGVKNASLWLLFRAWRAVGN